MMAAPVMMTHMSVTVTAPDGVECIVPVPRLCRGYERTLLAHGVRRPRR
jgi:hypothetical protein